MAQDDQAKRRVDQFILEKIDSVPHLEALLLMWRTKPKSSSLEDMTKALYIQPEWAQLVLQDLESLGLLSRVSEHYAYNPDTERDALMKEVEAAYRGELVRISNMIHSKASPAVRAFARAFRLKKD